MTVTLQLQTESKGCHVSLQCSSEGTWDGKVLT